MNQSQADGAFLADYENLDVKAGIERLNGNKAVYVDILRFFIELRTNMVNEIRSLYGSQDIEKAIFTTHTLKGTSGSIGADKLSGAAGKLQHMLEADAPKSEIEAELDLMDLEMKSVVQSINCLLSRV